MFSEYKILFSARKAHEISISAVCNTVLYFKTSLSFDGVSSAPIRDWC